MKRCAAMGMLGLGLMFTGAFQAGCQGTGRAPTVEAASPARALPEYGEIVRRYNERTDRLTRVWARAVVSINFTNDRGEHRREQGEGHLQMIQPSRLALSVGKLGEVLAWIGCDEDRYWLIDPKESKRAYVGRHALATPEKTARLGLPAAPQDLIRLIGVTPLAPASSNIIYGWAPDRVNLVVEERIGAQIWRHVISESQMRPLKVELLRAQDRVILVSAALEDYEGVALRGVGGYFPQVATRVTARQPDDGAEMRVSLAGMNDGGGSRLSEDNFSFDALLGALGVTDVVDLDAPVAAR